MKKILATALMAVFTLAAGAQHCMRSNVDVALRIGYSVGGTAPVGLPDEIRHLNNYTLQPNLQAGIDVHKPLDCGWGIMAGLRLENKGMQIDARVKNYHTAVVQGDQHLEGMFTGNVKTKVTEWMFTLPVEATFDVARNVRLKAGPYVSWVVSRNFDGYVHGGYLRVSNPTGAKVNMGEDEGTRGNYDFSASMRRMQWGVSAGVDWFFRRNVGAYFDLNWGLTGIHHSDFKTIDQTLYPIFGTVGLVCRL